MKRRINDPQSVLASLRDVRPELPKVEFASPWGIDILAAVRKRWFLSSVIALITLLLGAQYVMRRPKEFKAEAAVYVSPTYFKNVQQDREQLQISYSTLVNQQILTIRRFDTLRTAVRRLETQGIHWRLPGESEEAAVMRLNQQLDIQYITDSYEILIALSGKNREWLAPIVNTVTDAYLDQGKQAEAADHSARLQALTTEQSRVSSELQRKLDQQAQLSQKLTLVNLDKAAVADNARLTQVRQARDAAHQKRVESEAELRVMAQSKDASGTSLLDTLAEEAVTNDPDARPQIDTLLRRKLELQKSIAGLTPQHPLRHAAEIELADIGNQLVHLRKGLMDSASARLLVKSRADVERARLLEAELDREVDASTSQVQGVAKDVQLAQGVDADIDRLRRQQSAVNSRIDELTMPTDSAGYLRIFSAAQTPLEPNKSSSKKLLLAVLGVALFLGIGFAVAMDLIDQRVFSPFEIKRAVGFPPVGIVLEQKPGMAAFSEEHFRRLVNGIQRGVSTQEAKSIVLTPLRHARAGTLTSDIARVLVARGIKTAIVDANPHTHNDGVVKRVLPDVITLSDPLPPGIHNGASPVLNRIEAEPSGDVGPAPLISRISGLLEELERKYDVVLIDAPPLGLSADTEFLASISDIILVVVEAGEATRRELIRSASLLGRIGAPSVGVIMTEVRLRQAGGTLKREFRRYCSLSGPAVPERGQA